MQLDAADEAPSGRRLLVFAATAGAMLVVANISFARDPPLLAPPLVLGFIAFLGIGGILTWVDGRKARTVLLAGTAYASLVAGATAAGLVADWRGYVALILALDGVVAFTLLSLLAWKPRPKLEAYRSLYWAAGGIALALLVAVGLLVGPGPTLAAALGGLFILFTWLLRPAQTSLET